ncbi:MAG: NAD(P)-dependent glycerol-3-phosphate dehydrogenase [Candidatus Glassbacteria bacterium]|nr:NAD(P)-dependent glycerol-3-phosphate dehydrogenase [Candidatus Glassbacteria bacterium]
MRIAVIGAGSWGTTLADLLASKAKDVVLWSWEAEVAEQIGREHRNELYLPGVELSGDLGATSDIQQAVDGAEVVVTVCPTHVMREVLTGAAGRIGVGTVLVNASKGIECGSLKRISELVAEVLPAEKVKAYVVLSGPSFASEVAARRPTVITAASRDEQAALLVQGLFSTAYFRVYKHDDVVGVELGGSLKNVIAVATGMIEGAGLGTNTRAALITRGLAEIARLGAALGASAATFSGVSGLGDLVLTCTGDLSRNRKVGLRIGHGESLEEITGGEERTVAEGIRTTESAYELARKLGVEMPIVEQVHRILFEGQSVELAIRELMNRELKKEYE